MKKFSISQLKYKNILQICKKWKTKRNTDLSEKKNYRLYRLPTKNKYLNKKRKSWRLQVNLKKVPFLKKSQLPYIFLGLIVLSFIIIGVLLSPLFNVKYIIIKKDHLIDMNIAYKAMEDIRWRSTFSIDKKDLLSRFQTYQENIKSMDIKIRYPNTLDIKLQSYKELFNIQIGEKNYLLLENGSVVPKFDKTLPFLQVANNFWKNKFVDYKQIYLPRHIQKINKILTQLQKNLIDLEVNELKFFNIEREFHIQVNGTTTLLFSLSNDISIEEQVKNYLIFKKEYKVKNQEDIVYIDLRIKNKAFICNQQHTHRCNINLENIYPQVIAPKDRDIQEEKETTTWEWKENIDKGI